MTLTPERQAHVKRRLDAVVALAETARDAGDLAAAKRALSAAWFAIHDATTAINEAEKATREEACARLGVAA